MIERNPQVFQQKNSLDKVFSVVNTTVNQV